MVIRVNITESDLISTSRPIFTMNSRDTYLEVHAPKYPYREISGQENLLVLINRRIKLSYGHDLFTVTNIVYNTNLF